MAPLHFTGYGCTRDSAPSLRTPDLVTWLKRHEAPGNAPTWIVESLGERHAEEVRQMQLVTSTTAVEVLAAVSQNARRFVLPTFSIREVYTLSV